MSDLVGNPEDRFSHVAAHNISIIFYTFETCNDFFSKMKRKIIYKPSHHRQSATNPNDFHVAHYLYHIILLTKESRVKFSENAVMFHL